jgi:hypothetical protein
MATNIKVASATTQRILSTIPESNQEMELVSDAFWENAGEVSAERNKQIQRPILLVFVELFFVFITVYI